MKERATWHRVLSSRTGLTPTRLAANVNRFISLHGTSMSDDLAGITLSARDNSFYSSWITSTLGCGVLLCFCQGSVLQLRLRANCASWHVVLGRGYTNSCRLITLHNLLHNQYFSALMLCWQTSIFHYWYLSRDFNESAQKPNECPRVSSMPLSWLRKKHNLEHGPSCKITLCQALSWQINTPQDGTMKTNMPRPDAAMRVDGNSCVRHTWSGRYRNAWRSLWRVITVSLASP